MKAVKMRKCAGCGDYFDGKSMFRIIRTPEGEVLYDKSGRRSGRGVYLCKKKECVNKVFDRKAVDRSLHVTLNEESALNLRQALHEEMKTIEE